MGSLFPLPAVLLPIALVLLTAASVTVNSQPAPGCLSRCGSVDIHYPFGVGDGCSREGFDLNCENTSNSQQLVLGNIPIIEIKPLRSEVRANLQVARDCYDKDGNKLNTGTTSTNLTTRPLAISGDRNTFKVTGCDTLVYLSDPSGFGFSTGCVSVCNNLTLLVNDSCSGIGCCQTAIPRGLKYFGAVIQSFNKHTKVWSFNPCSYAFVSEDDSFVFNTSVLSVNYGNHAVTQPAVLDWIMGNDTCDAAKQNLVSYACRSSNSFCLDSRSGLGYICNCSQGYIGNPYLVNGCKDIDECKERNGYPCLGICTNTPGSYNCTCPPGTRANDPRTENCSEIPIPVVASRDFPLAAKLIVGLGSGFLFFLLVGSWVYLGFQKRKIILQRQNFFQQNGGLFLQQLITSHLANSFKIFAIAELERATKNFSEDLILGKGGHGTVYKGDLDDGRVVAIKKSMMVDESKSKEFANEMLILSQINHIHIVKLLGCCLEVEVPMLVYEYIPNGTLFHYIHGKRRQLPISFGIRLRIAAEAADALAYLNDVASPPILHGDVKSSNILLDEFYKAKVSDFGTSFLAANDKAQFTTLVQRTWGYLDPEYLQTGQLTDKSDVYSFGVVLVELFTGSEVGSSLVRNFIDFMTSNRLSQILDPQIMTEGLLKELEYVAQIALHCLQLKGEDRPAMREVAMELDRLRKSSNYPWVPHNLEEIGNLPGETSAPCSYDGTGYHSLELGM